MEESKSPNPNPNEIPTPKSQQNPSAQPGKPRKPYDLRGRTFEFAVRILDIAAVLPPIGCGKIADQLVMSGSSVGANVEEADGALSRPDKRRAFVIARKEAREARYWLRLVDRVLGAKISVRADIDEASELVYILSAIISKLE